MMPETGKRKKILLVEDDALTAMLERQQLEEKGYDIIHVFSGEDAVACMEKKECPVDLILMDIDLGDGMDGTLTAEAILIKYDIPIVFLSSHTEPEIVEKTENITSYGYVVKNTGIVVLDASIKMAFRLFHEKNQTRRKEEELKEILDATTGGIWIWDFTTDTIFFSDKYYTMLGYEPGEFPASYDSWVNLLHTDDRDDAQKTVEKYMQDKHDRYENQFRLRTKSGTYRWIYSSARVTRRDAKGNAENMIGSHEDITPRIEWEQELARSEELFRSLFELSSVGIALVTPDGRFTSINNRFCDITGYSREEILSLSFADITLPEDLEKDMHYIARVMSGEIDSFDLEKRYLHKDGHVVWVHLFSSVCRDKKGMVRFAIASITDITERKVRDRQIELLSRIADMTPASITVHDTEGNFIYANSETFTMHGYGKEEFISLNLHDLDVPESEALLAERFRLIAENGEARFESSHYRKDGSILPLEVMARSIEWDGRPAVLSIATDITERKRAEDMLSKSEARFRMIYENAPVMIDAFDETGRCRLWNRACEQVFGWTLEEINAHPEPLALFYPDPEVRRQVIETVVSKPDQHFREWSPLTKSGKVLTCMWANYLLPDGLVMNIGYDVTERKHAEEQLKLQSMVLDQIYDHVTITDLEGRITYVNRAELKTLQRSMDELVGRTTEVYGEDPERGATQREILETTLRDGSWRGEVVNSTADGDEIIMDCRTQVVFGDDGSPVALCGIATDITERKKHEGELLESKLLYQALFQQSPHGVVVIDPDTGGFLEFNDQVCRQLDYTREEFSRLKVFDIDAIETEDETRRRFGKVIAQGYDSFETLQRTKTGEIRKVHVIAQILKLPGRSIYHCIWSDITEQEKMEKTLREREILLNKTQSLSRVGGWEWDVENRTMTWTDETYRIHDMDPGDMMPGSPEHVDKSSACYGEDNRLTILEAFKNCAEKGIFYDMEFPFTSVTGRLKWVRTTAEAVWSGDRITRVVGNIMEITEQKKAEEALLEISSEYGLALESLLIGVVVHASDSRIIRSNEKASDILGLSPEQMMGREAVDPVWKFVHEDLTPLRVDDYPVSRVISTGKALIDYVLGIVRPDRDYVTWVTVNAIPLINSRQGLEKIIINFMDITKRKAIEEEIKSQLAEKELVLKEVHHRIKNNIASIGNMLKLQAGSTESGESRAILNDAVSRVESMRIIYDKLLLEDDYREISAKCYLEDLLPAIMDIFPAKDRVTVNKSIEDFTLPVRKLFPLGIILNELMTNSMKYAFKERDSGVIDISLIRKGKVVTLDVHDNGVGIPGEIDLTGSSSFGLMLVNMLSRQLKGKLSISSNGGVRSVLVFEI